VYIYPFKCDPFFKRRKGSFQSATWNVECFSVTSHGSEAGDSEENVACSPSCVNWWSGYARWKLWGCGLFVWSCMPARKFFSGTSRCNIVLQSRLSLKDALGGRRAAVVEKPGGGRFSSRGLASVVKVSWTRCGIRLEFHGFVEGCRSLANWRWTWT
jgi:hypothetical protein